MRECATFRFSGQDSIAQFMGWLVLIGLPITFWNVFWDVFWNVFWDVGGVAGLPSSLAGLAIIIGLRARSLSGLLKS